MPKDAYYFPHDNNARHDPKILKMRSIYKLEGLGLYWALIEMMREQENYMLPIDNGSIEGYALDLNCTADLLNKFINDCTTQFSLFSADGNYLWSDSLLRRMSKYDNKSEQAREAALIRWGATHSGRIADAMPTQCGRIETDNLGKSDGKLDTNNADAMRTQCGRNAKRVEESIINNNKIQLPDFIDKELWHDFMEMRTKKRIPNTDRAMKLLVVRLTQFKDDGCEPNKIIENSIMRGWTGVFVDKDSRGVNKLRKPSKYGDGW